ncbi:hypothetical protein CW751_06190 [Brumimicrobium salinarum]|uniref:Uncharacterized protein n=2 Tax=Brumimicrobium salinarum TaxID=2058658 RepID=A0A2I0R3M6_9FLAO|nr:hypothetical protein CW751_06190 [Brumimicrobium salinarum]
MKATLFILSLLLVGLNSCSSDIQENEIKHEEDLSTKINTFLNQLENWKASEVKYFNQLGKEISKADTLLTFFSFKNKYENNAFIFSAESPKAFNSFEESDLLKEEIFTKQPYKVWRRKVNHLRILDLSIEPHPTLKWIFVIRLRNQE